MTWAQSCNEATRFYSFFLLQTIPGSDTLRFKSLTGCRIDVRKVRSRRISSCVSNFRNPSDTSRILYPSHPARQARRCRGRNRWATLAFSVSVFLGLCIIYFRNRVLLGAVQAHKVISSHVWRLQCMSRQSQVEDLLVTQFAVIDSLGPGYAATRCGANFTIGGTCWPSFRRCGRYFPSRRCGVGSSALRAVCG